MKMKTHSGTSKRFTKTGSGKIVRRKAGKRHILTSKAARREAPPERNSSSGFHGCFYIESTPAVCIDDDRVVL